MSPLRRFLLMAVALLGAGALTVVVIGGGWTVIAVVQGEEVAA